MTRPRKGHEIGPTSHLTIRLPVALRARLEAESARRGTTVAEVVRGLLQAC
jgi:predicted DNA-binding protein